MATFVNASFLGISQESQFLGENTARLRTVKTFSIDGFIESKHLNPDFQGVKETVGIITNLNKTISGPTSNTSLVMEDIIINDVNYGKGKVISLNFAASDAFDETQINLGKYSATIEFYLAGDVSSVYGFVVPDKEFLEDFSEEFSFNVSEDGGYDYDHSVGVTYMEGTRANNSTIDPISAAKTLAQNVFSQTLSNFNGIIDGHFGGYSILGKKIFTESYDKETKQCSFSKKFTVHQKNGATYSARITNSFDLSEAGVATIVENGSIRGRSDDLLSSALDGMSAEIQNSFLRCQNIYNTYKNYFYVGSSLKNVIINFTKSINNNSKDVEYSVTYTDDKSLNVLGYTEERTIKLNKEATKTSVDESSTRTFFGEKSSSFLASILPLSLANSSLARCLSFYSQSGGSGSLKKIKSSLAIPKFGKSYNYSFSFVDSDSIFPSVIFVEKEIVVEDGHDGQNFEVFPIPNKRREILHLSNQQKLSSRTVSATAKLTRRQNSNFENYVDFVSQISTAVRILYAELKLKAYSVFAERRKILTLERVALGIPPTEIFISSFKYSIKSDYSMSMSVQVDYPALPGRVLN